MRPLFALCLVAIIHFSLHPWRFDPAGFSRSLGGLTIGSRSDYTDIVLNLFFYLPPALIGQWAFQTAKTKLRTSILIVIGLTLLSLSLETLQLAIPGRVGNLRDVACNAVASLAGVFLAYVIPKPAILAERWKLPPHVLSLAIFLTAWTAWLAFPFIPHLRLHRLLSIPSLLLNSPWLAADMGDLFFILLVLYLLARSLELPALPITFAAALLVPFQAFLPDLVLSPVRVTAAAFAILTAAILLRHPSRLHALSLALLISLWILYRQLEPALFLNEPINVFAWIPFRPLIENFPRAGLFRTLCGKFLLYTSALWLYKRAGLRLRLAAPALILVLGITESVQRYIPGRTPETTDLVLALLGTWTVSLATPSENAKRAQEP